MKTIIVRLVSRLVAIFALLLVPVILVAHLCGNKKIGMVNNRATVKMSIKLVIGRWKRDFWDFK